MVSGEDLNLKGSGCRRQDRVKKGSGYGNDLETAAEREQADGDQPEWTVHSLAGRSG